MNNNSSNIFIASMIAGTLALSGCGKKEEPVNIEEQRYQEAVNAIISDGRKKDEKKMERVMGECKKTHSSGDCSKLVGDDRLLLALGDINPDSSLKAIIELLSRKNREILEYREIQESQEEIWKYMKMIIVIAISLLLGSWSEVRDLLEDRRKEKANVIKRDEYIKVHNTWIQAKAELEKLQGSYQEIKKENNLSQRQITSLQKKIDELITQNMSLQEDVNSKNAFIQELEQNILPGLKVGSVAGDIVDSFQMMTNIIEQLQQKLEQAGNEEDIGNFIAYNRASVDSLFTEIELSFARFASISENDAHLLTPVIALFQEAKIAYTKHMYKTAFEKAMQSVGILGYLENLQSQSDATGTNNSSSENPQSIWSEYVVREGIPAEWLSSGGGLVDFFAVLELDKLSNWSSEFQKQVKKQFRKMASKYHPDKNKDVDATENFRLAKIACDVLGDGQLFHTYTQALAFYINNI